jgi:5-methylphenazine-1-carboxylate 1-monooxygenase
VEQLVGDKPFDDLDKYITQDELRAMSEDYKRIAGFALSNVDVSPATTATEISSTPGAPNP